MQIECYAQRLLNPFRGVVHTVRYESAEAVTMDGREWDIYVANDALLEGLGSAGRRAQISDIRYGHWSVEKGLKRGPLFPSEDFRRLENMGAIVYENLLELHARAPFAFRDQFELWLLDRRERPLALLHSVRNDVETDTRPPLDWRAGMAAHERFKSAAVAHPGESAGAYLSRYVNGLSGGIAQWFLRSDDGAGLGLHSLGPHAASRAAPSLHGRVLDATDFPALFVATTYMDAAHMQLVHDYHAWQAPWALLLPHLDIETRARLERLACQQAELVERHHRLYPAVIDRPALQAARVEAAFVQTTQRAPAANDSVSTEYIELNVSEE